MEKRKKVLYVGMMALFLFGIVGISYAMYTFVGTGTTENVITTGQIRVAFNEQNNIKIQNRYPETDDEGLANPDPNSQMTFTVSSDIAGDMSLNYAVGLTEIQEGKTLTDDYIKIHLEKNGNVADNFGEYWANSISYFETASVPGYLNNYVIAQGTVSGTQTDTYTLKAWIAEYYDLPTADTSNGKVHSNKTTSEEFSFKIKVVAMQEINLDASGANKPQIASYMIPVYYDETFDMWKKADTLNVNKEHQWYDYNNKMWANAVMVKDEKRDLYIKADAGTSIPMEDINAMWVWIPRFSAEKAYEFQITDLFEVVKLSENDKNSMVNDMCINYWDVNEEYCTESMETLSTGGIVEGQTLKQWLMYHGSAISSGKYESEITSEITYKITEQHKEELINDVCVLYMGKTLDECTMLINDAINNENDALLLSFIDNYLLYDWDYGSKLEYGSFDITFVGVNEEAHDAFSANSQIPGFWVGKFENSSNIACVPEDNSELENGCNTENHKLVILPNKESLRGISVDTISNLIQHSNDNFEKIGNLRPFTWLISSNRWGAVAYLSQSIYGRCTSLTSCLTPGINNNSNYKTGYGAPAGSLVDENNGTYNTTQGMNASTTGNIYGIYDMSGGADEYVRGYYNDGIDIRANEVTYDDGTLYMEYGMQHALTETASWYGGIHNFVYIGNEYFIRGGNYNEANANLFSYNTNDGTSKVNVSSRSTLIFDIEITN